MKKNTIAKKKPVKEQKCFCPYCDEEIILSDAPWCQACKIVFLRCDTCGITVLERGVTICPLCGATLC